MRNFRGIAAQIRGPRMGRCAPGSRTQRHRAPSPTSTNGAQYAGCASCGSPRLISASIDRRNASARPTSLPRVIRRTVPVTSFTVAAESTAQCDTKSARACA